MLKIKKININIKQFVLNAPHNLNETRKNIQEAVLFGFLLALYIFNLLIYAFLKIPFIPAILRANLIKFTGKVTSFTSRFNKQGEEVSMNRLEIFDLAFRNMGSKPSRTIITVGGMSVGVGTIIFLVTLGYGLQRLVIERVARLDEIKQADVSVQPGSNIVLNDVSVDDFKRIENVEDVLPLIGLVAKVDYQGSVLDVAVYGVTSTYLKNSAVKPINGKIFENEEISLNVLPEVLSVSNLSEVAGAKSVRKIYGVGDFNSRVKYSIFPESWVKVREGPKLTSKVIGYTKRVEGLSFGEEYIGDAYDPVPAGRFAKDANGIDVGKWVKSKVYIWEKKDCEKSHGDCYDGSYVTLRDHEGNQIQQEGYFAELEVMVEASMATSNDIASVLGVSDNTSVLRDSATESQEGAGSSDSAESEAKPKVVEDSSLADDLANLSDSPQSSLSNLLPAGFGLDDADFLSVAIESSASATTIPTKKLKMPDEASKIAIVNEAFLDVLSLDRATAIDKKFDVSFIVTSDLSGEEGENIVSEFTSYTIVAVVPGTDNPFFYVPLADLKVLGIHNYSQVKIISNDKENLADIRKNIENQGYITTSVADTVTRINSLFGSLRIVLGLVGAVALAVAALGMFNTLTVSLLERTREIGLMKAMGMTSGEVKRLFLTESMMMGLMGGLFGIILGYITGKLFSFILSIFGLAKGVGIIDVVYLPLSFALLVFSLSVFVGLITGIYPSRRATKISALNALRYE